ncbi:MAG TPA: pitrilysin family protein [Steroidobacteraceae bacterium]|jgi:zinc protease|nr:pitrilysin family protein [Steroidobacteraceae bacterium]
MKVPAHQGCTLPNGVKLILIPRHDVPLIAMEAVVRGGASLDQPALAGVASLTAELLTRGAGERDAFAFAESVEDVGGSFEAEAHSEAVLLHGQFLARDRDRMLGLLADALQRPHLAPDEFDTLRARRIEFIRAAKDSEPQSLIGAYGRSMLFAQHAYGAPIGGSELTLAAVQRQHLLGFYRQQFGADRLTLVLAGDFEPEPMKQELAARFEHWQRASEPLKPLDASLRVHGRRVLLIDAPGSTQTYFWIGNVGVARSYAARAALDVTNTAFGGSFGSMLVQALRVKSGLTYSVSSGFRRGSVPGEFAISSFTQTESTASALSIALQTLSALKRDGISAQGLNSARNYILGQYPLAFETAADWAGALAELDLYRLPDRYIDTYCDELAQVDLERSRQVIETAFPGAEDVDIVLIGDADCIRTGAAQFGPVTEKPLEAPDFEVAVS